MDMFRRAALLFHPPPSRIARRYRRIYGRPLDLENPKFFSEHIQAYKLHYRDMRMPPLVDKIEAKKVVADRLGQEWVTPSLFEGEALPDRRSWPFPYVAKTSHGCGQNIFVEREADEDWPQMKRQLRGWLSRPHGAYLGEWVYSQVRPRVLVEPLIADLHSLIDYKFFVFGGRVQFIQIHTDRISDHKNAVYDRDWRRTPYSLVWPVDTRPFPPPDSLAEMIQGAETLAKGLPFVRIDLYEIDGRPRFGEATFYPNSGLGRLSPGTDEVLAAVGRRGLRLKPERPVETGQRGHEKTDE